MDQQNQMPVNESQSPDQSGVGSIDVDQILSDIESQSQEPSQETQQEPSPQTPQEYEFTANGKSIKAPIDKILRWASSGYNAPQQISQYKQQAAEYQKQLQSFEDQRQRYGEVDEYVKQNPQFWDHVVQNWQSRQQQQGLSTQVPPELLQEINGIKSVVEQFQQEKLQNQYKQEDSKLTEQIQSTREKYGTSFDWESPNDSGLTLEGQVLDFGIKNGVKDFDTAFYMFKREELLKQAEDRGREGLAKEKQRQTKLGLLGKTPVPTKGLNKASNIKSKTYEQLMQEGLEEMGINLGG